MGQLLNRYKFWIIGLVVIAAGGAYYAVLASTPVVKVVEPQVRSIESIIEENASVVPKTKIVVSATEGGRITALPIEVGDRVEAGEVLTRLESTDQSLSVTALRARLAAARAAYQDARRGATPEELAAQEAKVAAAESEVRSLTKEMEEARVAYNKGQIEYRDYQQTVEAKKGAEARLQAEQAQLDRLRAGATEEKLRQLRANIDEIEAQLAQAEVSLERTELVSPINGTVLERPVEQGTVIQPGSPIAVIGDTETLEVESYVLAEDSIRVEPGQEVRITGDVLSAALPGIVKSVSSVAVTRQSELGVLQERVRVIIAPEDSTPLKPGYGVDVHIVVNAVDEALTVPAETVFHEGEHDFVFVVSGEKVSRRQVTVGVKQQSVFQLTEGLEQGELVVRNPSEELSDGDTVRVE